MSSTRSGSPMQAQEHAQPPSEGFSAPATAAAQTTADASVGAGVSGAAGTSGAAGNAGTPEASSARAKPARVKPAIPGAPRRWKPSPFITGSAALHAGAAAAVVLQPALWPWALGSVAGSHLALTAAGLWPRSTLLGLNWTNLPPGAEQQIALTIDDGPNPEVTPRVLDLLDRYDARATFFCIGEVARRHPQIVEAIVARGHAVENHSQRHRHNFSLLGPRALEREIAAAQRTLTELSGSQPWFFRAPAGLRNPFLEPVLCRLGLYLASWTRRGYDTRTRDAAVVTQRLLHGLAPRDILLVHDGHPARDARNQPVVLDVLPAVLAAAAAAQLRCITLRAAIARGAENA